MSMEKQSSSAKSTLPEGTVTFLFTDIEGSTKLLHRLGDKYISLLDDHHRILREVFTKWHGREVDTEGDAFFVSFPKATEALTAVIEAQRTLAEHSWPEGEAVRVRMGLHTGEPWTGSGGYVGMDVHRAARIAHVGYGGQVLLSETTAALLRGNLPEDVKLRDLGQHLLKDMQFPEHIRQLVVDGLPSEFPPLKSLEIVKAVDGIDVEPPPLPVFLTDELWQPRAAPVFVCRDSEMAFMTEFMDALFRDRDEDNRGNVLFVIGDAGSGKTSLMDAFSRQAISNYPDFLVAKGYCNTFTGFSDPYLPFRQVMRMLTGDIDAQWMAGNITQEQAVNLWTGVPLATKTVTKYGPDLIGTFVPASGLVSRISATSPGDIHLANQLRKIAEGEKASPGSIDQFQFHDQISDILREISKSHPILLLLDDLQWADNGSISLLYHLVRSLVGARVQIIGAYRPEDVTLGSGYGRHPLAAVLDEIKRIHGDIWIDLNDIEGSTFVHELLDSESNRLSNQFRRLLYSHTGGHALFTVELLRVLEESGNLIQDAEGYWIESPNLEWGELPTRVEGVIETRIGRLDDGLREILNVASVMGFEFIVPVVAQVNQSDERSLLKALSRELQDKQRLVKETGTVRIAGRECSKYTFSHLLFQQYLYSSLPSDEIRYLNEKTGEILEAICSGQTQTMAVQLARYFTEAKMPERAVEYQIQAGDQARAIHSFAEAEQYYTQAIRVYRRQGQEDQVAKTLMKLGLVYTATNQSQKAQTTYAEAFQSWKSTAENGRAHDIPRSESVLKTITEQPHTLDPAQIRDDVSTFWAAQLFEGLVRIGEGNNVLPAVAERWEVNENGTRYRFHLRPDARWSNGIQVTASDFEFAWKRLLEPETRSPCADLFVPILNVRAYREGIINDSNDIGFRAIDERLFEIHLENPTAYLPYLLTHTATYPISKIAHDRNGRKYFEPDNLVCNGPYKLETWKEGERITLVHNDYYSGDFPGNITKIECSTIEDFGIALAAYDANAVDVVSLTNADQGFTARVKATYGDELVYIPRPSTLYLFFRVDKPPFDDVRVRKAFAHAINRESLATDAIPEMSPATGGFIPPSMGGYTPDMGLTHDPERARRLMMEAGYPNGRGFPRVSWLHSSGSRDERLIPILRNTWKKVLGTELEPQDLTWAEFYARLQEDPANLTVAGWTADYPDPDGMLRTVFHSTDGLNRPRWHNGRFNTLVNEAAKLNDPYQRIELYRDADRILVAEQAAAVPLGYGRGRMLVKPWVYYPESLYNPLLIRFFEKRKNEFS